MTPTLAAGSAGIALFYAYLGVAFDQPAASELALCHLGNAIDSASRTDRSGLFTGLAGIAWTLCHLERLLPDHVERRTAVEVDALIEDLVGISPWPWHHDLIYGLSGLGCYALEHPDRRWSSRVWDQILSRLEELADARPGGHTWWTPPRHLDARTARRFPAGYCNLGVAHGVAGVIGVIARGHAERPRGASRRLLEGAISWLLEQGRDAQEGSVYPPYFTTSPADGRSARSGWCYGDPGIAISLLAAARALGDRCLEQRAIALALRDAERGDDLVGVVDAPLCHGAAGLGHLYNRLYQATGEEACADVARRWFERALNLQHSAPGTGPFPSWWPHQKRWRCEPGLLDGAAGVGLALIAAVSSTEPRWDRVLLLDVEPLPVQEGVERNDSEWRVVAQCASSIADGV